MKSKADQYAQLCTQLRMLESRVIALEKAAGIVEEPKFALEPDSAPDSEWKTYDGWKECGRQVTKGQKSAYKPSWGERRFHISQTDEKRSEGVLAQSTAIPNYSVPDATAEQRRHAREMAKKADKDDDIPFLAPDKRATRAGKQPKPRRKKGEPTHNDKLMAQWPAQPELPKEGWRPGECPDPHANYEDDDPPAFDFQSTQDGGGPLDSIIPF